MPKVPRKETGGATHARERGDAKQARASAATPVASAVADDVPRLSKIRTEGGAGPFARPSSPDSPHHVDFEPRAPDESAPYVFSHDEKQHVDALARALCAIVLKQGSSYEGFDRDVRVRLFKIVEGKRTPAMNSAADKLFDIAQRLIRRGSLACVNSDPGASLRLENAARELILEGWQRMTDARMVNTADEMEPSAPTDWKHMARKHGEPCFTQKIGMMHSAYVFVVSLPFPDERDDLSSPHLLRTRR